MRKGDIILVPFPFTSLSGSNRRPALVLLASDLDVTVCFISTKLDWEESTDLILKPEKANGLKKKSLVRTSKIATIDKSLAIGKLGAIDVERIKELDRKLIAIFEIKIDNKGGKYYGHNR